MAKPPKDTEYEYCEKHDVQYPKKRLKEIEARRRAFKEKYPNGFPPIEEPCPLCAREAADLIIDSGRRIIEEHHGLMARLTRWRRRR